MADGTFTTFGAIGAHNVQRSDIEKQFGAVNVATWADKDNDGDAAKIAANIDYAQLIADRRIAARAFELRTTVPDANSQVYSVIQDYETTFAGIFLYMSRGEPTSGSRGPDGAGPYTAMMEQAEEQLTGALTAFRDLGTGPTGTYEAGPVPIASGSNRSWQDNLPAQPFGLRYGWNGYGRWPW